MVGIQLIVWSYGYIIIGQAIVEGLVKSPNTIQI